MARVSYVKAAQPRYAMVPVLDENGEQVKVPVMNKRTGEQKVSKRGPVFKKLTKADKSKQLPLRKCGKCGKDLEIGQPYKHISPKSGPYGGRTLFRCATCPTWQIWEYSSSLSARVAELQHNATEDINSATTQDELEAARDAAAEAVRELAEEKRESAQNIEDGFQHATYQSDELNQLADDLDSWADEIENVSIDDIDLTCAECSGSGDGECDCHGEDADCEHCGGTGTASEKCEECNGTGEMEEPSDEALEDARTNIQEAVDSCPV